jgi:pSer/pThr/pTyr-binding forkhead associated (FHA) protein
MPPDYCPYRGLDPYTEEDRRFFFGRKQDEKIIAANLFAARLTVLYGGSGVGKTSVLRAGVIPDLQTAPHVAVVFFNTWQPPDFEATLKTSIAAAVSQSVGSPTSLDPLKPLDEFVLECANAVRGRIFLIFDQFEEYFLYHGPTPAEHGFEAEFARLVNRRNIDAHVMLSLREDGLSKLDRFQGRIPNLLGNMLRLGHLDRKAANSAIREPLRVYNETTPPELRTVSIEDALVETLLADPGLMRPTQNTMRSEQSLAGQEKFETPLLQLVLTRIWDEEKQARSNLLRLATLRRLGGAKRIVDRHLASVMTRLTRAERDAAAKIFRSLVTPDGSKVACTLSALAGSAELPQEKVQRVVTRLSEARILRTVATPGQPPRYEIFHDVLGASISDWRSIYIRRRKRHRRLLQAAAVALLLFGAGVVFYRLWYLPLQARQPWGSVRVLSTGNVYDLKGDLATLGRYTAPTGDTTPPFKTDVSFIPILVSRLHLLITRDLLALDVRSRNGTTINAGWLPYGFNTKLQSGDIIVLGGVAAMQFERPQLSRWFGPIFGRASSGPLKPIAIPEANDWAILIDGSSRTSSRIQYLHASPSFIGVNSDNVLIVKANSDTATLLKASFYGKTDESGIPLIEFEGISDTTELLSTWKQEGNDYEYPPIVITRGQQLTSEGIVLSYGNLRFQIVPVVPYVDHGGTTRSRQSSAH